MSLWIRKFRSGQVADEIWNGTYEAAQDLFCQKVRDGVLDRIEIHNSDDELLFCYPAERALRVRLDHFPRLIAGSRVDAFVE